eukprot:8035534-Alexandrium_andersonii.AAC.1
MQSLSRLVKIGRGPKSQPASSRSQLARRAKWPSPRVGICRNSEPPTEPQSRKAGRSARGAK